MKEERKDEFAYEGWMWFLPIYANLTENKLEIATKYRWMDDLLPIVWKIQDYVGKAGEIITNEEFEYEGCFLQGIKPIL